MPRGVRLQTAVAWADRRDVAAPPAYPSQEGSEGGHRTTDRTVSDRTYHCPNGGLVLDRDLNAPRKIVRVG
jgi:transposase